MKLEVLISVMHQTNIDFIKDFNLKSDALIINQCDKNSYNEIFYNGFKVRIISTTTRGLSRSRNEALLNTNGEICILCDDDVVYKDDYVDIIRKAFDELRDADIIVFNTLMLNYGRDRKRNDIQKIRRSPKLKNYGSVRIAFKVKSFNKHNLWFNINFGAGGIYSAGEESLILRNANKCGLKIYEYPGLIASVDYSESTWFKGYNEKFFFDIGAWLNVAYPITKVFLKYYYPIAFYKYSNLKFYEILRQIDLGEKSYNKLIGFDEIEKVSSKSEKVN